VPRPAATNFTIRAPYLAHLAQRVDVRPKQRLVGVDVADACDAALVE